MKKILFFFIVNISCLSVTYFDAYPTYTDLIQGQISSKIIKDHGSKYQYDWQAAGDSKNYIWDGIRFKKNDNFKISLDSNINYESGFEEKNWQNILIEGTSSGVQRKVELNSNSILNGNGYRTLKTQNLILKDTEFSLNGSRLFFSNAISNSLTLENSTVFKNIGDILILSPSVFTLNSKSGSNKLFAWSDNIFANVVLNIDPNSELNLSYLGNKADGSKPLQFGSSIIGDIDNSKLKIEYSNIKFVSLQDKFIFKNNSILQLKGSQTSVDLAYATFDHSNIIMGKNTSLKGDIFKFNNSEISIDSNGEYYTSISEFSGDNIIIGSNFSTTKFKSEILLLNSNASVNSENISNIDVGILFLKDNSILNINNNNFVINSGIISNNGDINIKKHATVNFLGNYIDKFTKLDLNIDLGGVFKISEKAFFSLNNRVGTNNDHMKITNNGNLIVSGYLEGSGTILGSGITTIEKDGKINPAYVYGSYNGNLKFENKLVFNDGIYYADIDLDSNLNEVSDKIIYMDNNIDFQNKMTVKLAYFGKAGRSALDFQNKKFTIIQSDSVNSQGDILGDFSDITIIDNPKLPALLDFKISDEQTNGNKDITLIGEVQGVKTLSSHDKIKGHYNAQKLIDILPQASGSNLNSGAQQLYNSLLTVSNGQLDHNLNSLHGEPYSSYLTVGLEQNDTFLNSVMDHALPKGDVYHSKNIKDHNELIPNTRKNIWVDTMFIEGDVDGENGLGSFKYNINNVILGKDIYERGRLVLGVFAGHGYQKMNEHDSVKQKFNTDSYHIGTYGNYRYNNWVFTGLLGYSYGKNETERDIVIGTSSGTSKDKFNSHGLYTGLRALYPIKIDDRLTLAPNVGISYSYISQEKVKESGFDMADLTVERAGANSLVTSAGVHLEYQGMIKNKPVRPMVYAKYEHDWSANKDSAHDVTAYFNHTPNSKQVFSGQNRGENIFIMGLEVEFEATPSLMIGGRINYSDDSNGSEKEIGINFEYFLN